MMRLCTNLARVRLELPAAALVLACVVAAPTALAQDPAAETASPDPAAEGPATPEEAAPAEPTPAAEPEAGTSPSATGEPEAEPATTYAVAKGGVTVSMRDFSFAPATVTIGVGDSVTWVNDGEEPHTATADNGSFDTGELAPGGSGSQTLSSAGSFAYSCTLHPGMVGTVVVQGPTTQGGDDPDDPGAGGTGPSSEAAATDDPDAAGTADSLPSTGQDELPLLLSAAVLICLGALARRAAAKTGV
jgi:plastocyanin